MVFLPHIHRNFEIKVGICLIDGNMGGADTWSAGAPELASEDQQPLYEACTLSPVHPLVAVCFSLR